MLQGITQLQVGVTSELLGHQGERRNSLSLSLVGCVLQCVLKAASGDSTRTAPGSQACAAVLCGAPGPGIASMGQQQTVLRAIGADEASDG